MLQNLVLPDLHFVALCSSIEPGTSKLVPMLPVATGEKSKVLGGVIFRRIHAILSL